LIGRRYSQGAKGANRRSPAADYDLIGLLISMATEDPITCFTMQAHVRAPFGYLNNNQLLGTADGPTLPAGWSLVAP
jgi:hypothetical protein